MPYTTTAGGMTGREHPRIGGQVHTFATRKDTPGPAGRMVVTGTTKCGLTPPGVMFADSLNAASHVYRKEWCPVCRPPGR